MNWKIIYLKESQMTKRTNENGIRGTLTSSGQFSKCLLGDAQICNFCTFTHLHIYIIKHFVHEIMLKKKM